MLPYPSWLDLLTGERHEQARVRWLIRLYALYATEEGTLREFAKEMGLSTNQIKTQTQSQFWREIPIKTAIMIEQKIGRAVAPRERLRPDVYHIPEMVDK